jgi:hypothetical protein
MKTFMTYFLRFFYPTAWATAYGRRPKFVRAKHLATAKGENCAYGPTLKFSNNNDLLCAWRDFNETFCGISVEASMSNWLVSKLSS